MKKSQPKIILNVSLESAELEEKVKIAMDDYIENVIFKNLEDEIAKIIEKRIDALISNNRWDDRRLIKGKTLDVFIKEKTEATIAETIEKNAKRILAEKLAKLI